MKARNETATIFFLLLATISLPNATSFSSSGGGPKLLLRIARTTLLKSTIDRETGGDLPLGVDVAQPELDAAELSKRVQEFLEDDEDLLKDLLPERDLIESADHQEMQLRQPQERRRRSVRRTQKRRALAGLQQEDKRSRRSLDGIIGKPPMLLEATVYIFAGLLMLWSIQPSEIW